MKSKTAEHFYLITASLGVVLFMVSLFSSSASLQVTAALLFVSIFGLWRGLTLRKERLG